MTDQKPSVQNVFDDGVVTAFTASGSVGIAPNRPVCVTGNMKVQQILLVADRFIGVAQASGTEGSSISVRRKGTVKSYATGTVESGDFLVATGTSTAAAFKAAAAVSAVSGAVYFTSTAGAFKVAGQAIQAAADGDQFLLDIW